MFAPTRLVLGALLCAWLGLVSTLSAAETASKAPRDAASVRNEMRLKSLTRDLELTADQQKKVLALLEEEAKVLAKIREDEKLSIAERGVKMKETTQATYDKMKPFLTEPQLAKFEKMQAAANKPKKKN
jgi:hypothetical protein